MFTRQRAPARIFEILLAHFRDDNGLFYARFYARHSLRHVNCLDKIGHDFFHWVRDRFYEPTGRLCAHLRAVKFTMKGLVATQAHDILKTVRIMLSKLEILKSAILLVKMCLKNAGHV